jgi:hypothetical protein
MKRLLPFLFVAAGTFIALTVLFVFTRPGTMPKSVRAIDWRKIDGSVSDFPVEVFPVEEIAV